MLLARTDRRRDGPAAETSFVPLGPARDPQTKGQPVRHQLASNQQLTYGQQQLFLRAPLEDPQRRWQAPNKILQIGKFCSPISDLTSGAR